MYKMGNILLDYVAPDVQGLILAEFYLLCQTNVIQLIFLSFVKRLEQVVDVCTI